MDTELSVRRHRLHCKYKYPCSDIRRKERSIIQFRLGYLALLLGCKQKNCLDHRNVSIISNYMLNVRNLKGVWISQTWKSFTYNIRILESIHLKIKLKLQGLFSLKKSIIYIYHKSPKYPKKRVYIILNLYQEC